MGVEVKLKLPSSIACAEMRGLMLEGLNKFNVMMA